MIVLFFILLFAVMLLGFGRGMTSHGFPVAGPVLVALAIVWVVCSVRWQSYRLSNWLRGPPSKR